MAAPLVEAMEFLKDFGFYDVVLPFLLIFTIVFAVLQKTEVLGKQKNIDSMVAFAIALFFVAAPKVVDAIQISLPRVAAALVVLMSLMLLIGFVASKEGTENFLKLKSVQVIAGLLVAVTIGLIFLDAFDYWDDFWEWSGFDTGVAMAVLFLAIMALIIWFVSKGEGGGSNDG